MEFEIFERRNGEVVTVNIKEDMLFLTMAICTGQLLFLLSKSQM
jgi:hypothetical protein